MLYGIHMTTTAHTLTQVGTYTITTPRFSANRFEMQLVASGLRYRRAGREFAVTIEAHQVGTVITHSH